ESAIYVNIEELKRQSAQLQSVSSDQSSTHSLEWETHTDQQSGQLFYYNAATGETTWDSPFDQGEDYLKKKATECSGDENERYPEEDYSPTWSQGSFSDLTSERSPKGWISQLDKDGQTVYTSKYTHEKWIRVVDSSGKPYYYEKETNNSLWELPKFSTRSKITRPLHHQRSGNELDQDGNMFTEWPQDCSVLDAQKDSENSTKGKQIHLKNESMNSNFKQIHQNYGASMGNLEKVGIVNKTKVADNGKRLRKNWSSSWTVLHGGVLTFYKDTKSQQSGSLKSAPSQIQTEYTVDLRRATICWAPREKSSKKNVLELKTRNGSEYLIQYDSESIIGDWHKALLESIRQLNAEDPHEESSEGSQEPAGGSEKLNNKEKEEKDKKNRATRQVINSTNSETDPKNVRSKLKKLLQRRPTIQTIREKGYIKDQVFGCRLEVLCEREKTNIPVFVQKCITTVEKRGLDIDGIYRVSGNLAVIQKLRFKVDHEENLDLDNGQWEDIHVITGALKLFFRELPEPLFPFSHFDKFIAAIKIADYSQRVKCIRDLVGSLPPPNHTTMKLLFKHLRKSRVIEYHDENRMSVQSVAIVFGPTLLKPEIETGNIAVHMVFQNQIVEHILKEYERIF
uniref:Rho GTPase activating protein 27 n=1 Tax=Latimeria chalumnae TaxID=7897 RepID=H2ZYV7_LATCH